jgi:2,3-bisphosphoglycerate-independent phosphoglycerate mutase
MKLIIIVLDGIADRPVKDFDGLTPLETADTPNLDFLAKNGKTGLINIMGKHAPETDTAVLALFGYNPLVYSRGRGPLEVYGSGLGFKEGNLALRCNFATVYDGKVIDTRAGRIKTKYAKKLVEDIQQEIKLETLPINFTFKHTLNYRAVLIFHSEKGKLSDQISNTHPGYSRKKGYLEIAVKTRKNIFKKCKPLDASKEAKISAKLVNEFTEKSHELLEHHRINKERVRKNLNPANFILMRGAGTQLPNLRKLRGKWLCMGDTPAERGIARLLGMKLLDLPEPGCDMLSKESSMKEIRRVVMKDMKIRVSELLKNLNSYDSFYFHIKGADPFGHAGMPEAKKAIIEAIDKWFFEKLLTSIDLKNTAICVTSDHTTACSVGAHTADPVPVLISGNGIKPDKVIRFGESFCRKGSLGTFKATKFLSLIEEVMK